MKCSLIDEYVKKQVLMARALLTEVVLYTNNRKAIRVDKVVAVILYKLAFGHTDRTIGQKFV